MKNALVGLALLLLGSACGDPLEGTFVVHLSVMHPTRGELLYGEVDVWAKDEAGEDLPVGFDDARNQRIIARDWGCDGETIEVGVGADVRQVELPACDAPYLDIVEGRSWPVPVYVTLRLSDDVGGYYADTVVVKAGK